MIYFLEGTIELKEEKFFVIRVGGIGYKVFCSPKTAEKLLLDKKVRIFTNLYLREESAEFYGFLTQKELEFFEILNEIPGIGPKAALSISSVGSIEQMKKAVESGDQKFFEGIRGIGKKKIQKIILELTGKFKDTAKKTAQPDEVLDALSSLGFPSTEAKQALSQIPEQIKNPEEKIKEALKILGKRPFVK